MAETLLQKAQRLKIQPTGQPATSTSETLLQKAQRLGIQPEAFPTPTPPSSPSTGSKLWSGLKAGLKQAASAGIGALKSIPFTTNEFSHLGQRGLQTLTSKIPGVPTKPETPSFIPPISTPTNRDQKAGFLGGQVAQTFAIPNRTITKGATEVADLANAKKLQPFLSAGAKAAAEVVTGVGTAKLQGQSDKNALIAGGAAGVLSASGNVLSPLLKRSAEKSYSKALGATTKENKALSERVVPKLIENKTFSLTRQGLFNKAGRKADSANEVLDEIYSALPKNTQSDWKPVLSTLQKQKDALTVNGVVMDVGKYRALQDLQTDLLKVIGGSAKEAKGAEVSIDSARKAKQILDKTISRKTKTFGLTGSESDILFAQKEGANAIRAQLAAEHPNIDAINKEFNFWHNVQEVLGATIQRTKSQANLTGELATDTGAVVGAAAKGTVGTIAGYAILGKLLNATVKSTAWRTTSGITKASLANFLAKGELAKATTLLQRIANPPEDK